jgi:hypothetical protein
MKHPSLNASNEVWEDYLRCCSGDALLSTWTFAADNGDRRIMDMARNAAAGRMFYLLATQRGRIPLEAGV